MNCNLSDTDYFPLTFKDQSLLIYLNLVNSPFELLPSYNYLKCLRVLDVSGCSDLKELRCLPSTLAELYIYYCNSLNIVTFESHRFTLQEFGYEGCVNLCEVEGLFKLMPVTKLEESDLKHMTWLREYQDLKVCLVGDAELTKGRSSCVQMLYEFNIMSTSLPNITNSNMMTDTDYIYTSQSTLLSFKVPACPEHRRLEGLNITFQYTAHGEDWVWFVKISTPSGVNLMYNPRVFGKADEVGMWSSYWPIGTALQIEETVTVSIVVIKGLDIHWCGASLVYTDEGANEPLQENKECVAILGEDFSEFQLSTGAYYLCRRDFFELMEAGKLTSDWFRILVDDKIDYTEVGGWRKTGKPEHPYQSYTEVKTIRCIMYGPEMEGIYKIAELSKSSLVDKTMESTSEHSKAIPMDMVINETMASTKYKHAENNNKSIKNVSGQKNQDLKTKGPAKSPLSDVTTLTNFPVVTKPIDDKKEEESTLTKVVIELARKAEELKKKEILAQLKEQRRLEEKAKAAEALERKKRTAEKAQMRAELRARKEAEQKEKEREKRLRKKEKKKAGDGSINGEEPASSKSSNEATTKEIETLVKENAKKKTQKRPAHFFSKQLKPKPIPPPLINRNKKQWQLWGNVALAVVAIIAVIAFLYVLSTGRLLDFRVSKAKGAF